MTDPKNKADSRRVPGPKSKRPIIPSSFQISRISPMRQILDEAEGAAQVRPPIEESLVPETSLVQETILTDQQSAASLVPETSLVLETNLVPETSLVSDHPQAWSETRLVPETTLVPETNLVQETKLNGVDLFAGLPEVEGYLQIPNRIADHLLPLLAPYSQLIYFRLYRLSWGFSKPFCTVSLARLAERTHLSQSSVQRAIADLEQKGLIRKSDHIFGKSRPQGVTYEVVSGTSLVSETTPSRKNSLVRETNNKYLKENIKSDSREENPVYAVRTIAVRFREIHHGRSDYSIEQLRADVITALEGQGLTVDDATIDEALRGVTL